MFEILLFITHNCTKFSTMSLKYSDLLLRTYTRASIICLKSLFYHAQLHNNKYNMVELLYFTTYNYIIVQYFWNIHFFYYIIIQEQVQYVSILYILSHTIIQK